MSLYDYHDHFLEYLFYTFSYCYKIVSETDDIIMQTSMLDKAMIRKYSLQTFTGSMRKPQ